MQHTESRTYRQQLMIGCIIEMTAIRVNIVDNIFESTSSIVFLFFSYFRFLIRLGSILEVPKVFQVNTGTTHVLLNDIP